MKSRRDAFETRRLLLIGSKICYGAAIFLIILFTFARGGYAAIAVTTFVALLLGIMCSLYAYRQKEILFCPKCGSEHIVTKGFMGIPKSITDICPDCKKKINIDQSADKD